jgi:glycosyltransferase involved in cell wall biosynthesis
MKIAIDASRIDVSKKTGTEHYSFEIIKNLLLVNSGKKTQYVLYSRKPILKLLSEFSGENLANKIISLPRFWTQIGLAWKMLKDKPDVLFIPAHTIPWIHPKKTAAMIHGLEYEYFPDAYSFFEKFHLRLTTRLALKWTKKIIVPSQSTKNDLIKFYRANPKQIKVIYHGFASNQPACNAFDVADAGRQPAISSQQSANKYILFIGRLEKRKNLVSLIQSFEKIREYRANTRELFTNEDIKLVLAGKKGFGFKEIEKACENSPYKNDIILKDYVSEKEKKDLLKNADVFAFVSLYEGFGFPILEAMEAGVPVVASNNSSLSEIAGNAALLVDPQNTEEISQAIYKIFNDDSLKKFLIEKGKENIKRFDWQKCAQKTLEVLNE